MTHINSGNHPPLSTQRVGTCAIAVGRIVAKEEDEGRSWGFISLLNPLPFSYFSLWHSIFSLKAESRKRIH